MKAIKHIPLALLLALALFVDGARPPAQAWRAAPAAAPISPTPKWQYKGCFSSWCQTGWYSSPAVADLNGDGKPEVIWSSYSIYAIDGATGAPLWTVRSGHDRSANYDTTDDVGRTWPGIVVTDIDDDGAVEIVTAHSDGWVGVYNGNGFFKPGWPQQPFAGHELRSLAVDDLDGDGKMEIVVARTTGGGDEWTVLEPNGTTRPGWPQLAAGKPGYAAGAYNENVGVADIDGDGRGEIIGPSDVHYISAFNDDGSQVPANARYNSFNPAGPKFWSQVGVHVDDYVDLRGYADCGVEHRPNFANSPPDLVDIDGDGTLEIVVVGNVHNCGTDPYTDLVYLPFVFNKDRSRWTNAAYNWTAVPPIGGTSGPPLSEDYNLIENVAPNPALADLDGDGIKELLFASYDGKMHAYWMDKTEHGSWPFTVTGAGSAWAFASEPVVADLDGDGKAEVIFTTWPRTGGGRVGSLIVTDWRGVLKQQIALPAPLSDDWNGALAAPTIANIDADADMELVVGTVASGVVAYDLPGSANARVLWATGRGSFLRTGALPPPSSFTVGANALPRPGDIVTFRMVISPPANTALVPIQFSDTLPANLTFVGGSLSASQGTPHQSGATITWSGKVRTGRPLTITFQARISAAISSPTVITNNALVSGGMTMNMRVVLVVNGKGVWLPLVRR
jgi:uncharacterized repeat protein (TIGR01451 family)